MRSTITTLLAIMLLAALPANTFAQTIINQNGDFSDATEGQTSDITNWLLEGTDYANFEVVADPDDPENLVLQVTLTNIDGIDAWNVQAMNTGTQYSAANDYQISFRVRGAQDGTVQLDGGSGAQLWGQNITGGSWQTLQTGMFSPESDESRLVAIHFAHENNQNGDVFYIDDIEVAEFEGDGGDGGTETEIVNVNGDFSGADVGQTSGITNWVLEGSNLANYEVIEDPDNVENKILQATITDIDGAENPWSIQPLHQNVPVETDSEYQISARVKYDNAGGGSAGKISVDAGLSALYEQDISSGEWEVINLAAFTATEDASIQIGIHLGFDSHANGDILHIDYLRVEKVTETGTDPAGPPSTDQVVWNFDNPEDLSGWVNGVNSSQTLTASEDNTEGEASLQWAYTVDPSESWGGSADIELMLPEGNLTDLTDAEGISLDYKVLTPATPAEGGATFNIKLYVESGVNGEELEQWHFEAPAVISDDSGEWQTAQILLEEFAIPDYLTTHDGELYPDRISKIEMQVLVGSDGSEVSGEVLLDNLLPYTDQPPIPEPPYAVGDIINYNGSLSESELGETAPVAWTISSSAESMVEVVSDAVDADERALSFTVNWNGSTNWYENEVVNEPINVSEGDVYRISANLKGDVDGRIARLYLGMPQSGNYERARGFETPELELTSEWQEFSFEHTITANNETHGMRVGIEFNNTVNDGAIIHIDDVRVTKLTSEEEMMRPVLVEAESGELGSEWETLSEDGVDYINITTDFNETSGSGSFPGAERTASYSVTFPAAGEYDLFARVRVGTGGFDDDSFFEPNGFGEKDPANEEDWFVVNGLASAGFSAPDALVRDAGGLGDGIWKWVNVSKNAFQGDTTLVYVVEDELTQTFQIGAREDGQEIDKFAFGRSDLYYTVENLDNGEPGSVTDPTDQPAPTNPIAEGKEKWLGNIYSSSQIDNFTSYWNQVTPENAGKWGSVEGTRDQMNWTELDASYNLAKDNGYPFRFHVLVWGGQQPGWINDLSTEEQLEEITEWFDAVAERYPDIDYLEVVNEGSNGHQLPDGISGDANYIEALGGTGDTGHDWIITAFEMARERFPDAKLMINDYGIVGSTTATSNYIDIIEDLQAEGLIDVIGVQAHAFSTTSSSSQITTTLDMLGATGLPIQATEMDIDGNPSGTEEESDQLQLQRMERIFPLFWEHPSVEGVTFWGWRPGLWRQDQDAFLIRNNGVERPALEWLRTYVESHEFVSNENISDGMPKHFRLYDNYPNPFNPTTQIQYDLASASDVRIRVFDVIGRQITTLVNAQQSPGTYNVRFDASGLSSGIYFYRIETDSFVATKQMMLIK